MFWALAGALMIGLSLGLMGSGGSILTVPVLTFLVGQDEKVAIAGSLGIVGAISLIAAIPYARSREIDFRSVLYFGVPGMGGAYGGAYLSQFVSGSVQLAVFAALMLLAGVMMLRPTNEAGSAAPVRSVAKIILDGVVVGVVTGFVGVGGGFMIVPALVLLGGLTMHRAVGTSLVIIAMKSFTGFYKYVELLDDLGLRLDWQILGTFAAIGILGSFAGKRVGADLPSHVLKRGFAIFLLLISAFIVFQSWRNLTAEQLPADERSVSGSPAD